MAAATQDDGGGVELLPSDSGLRLLSPSLLPSHKVFCRPCPDEEGRHRDKRPKNHRHHHHQLLLLPDVHISDTLRLNRWESIVTVESITVKHIKHGGTCAKIYGNVIASDDDNQQVLFRLKPCESDAKTIGDDLKLKGPHFSALDPSPWGSIGINYLVEDRGDG
ncbi:unnamed protein product [Cuscuta campestris]|uniref:Uncharacterized protein n=1 Tax=Cuscuta campestris TaxID=132261 RepID=A0A484LDK6_9ASTE|nr:unnamed protein product [Cuscuta campestris]